MRQHICKAVPNWAAFSFPNEDNITSVTRNGIKTTCVYDSLGQLIRVNNPSDTTSGSDGTTWVYDYDRGGNILNKKRYAYTTGTVGDVLQTIEYTYGDTNWKDKMTAYNGTAITYDAIGNPVTYGNWTYTWEKGRQLKKMEHTNGTIVEYAYNSEGLRVSKTVTNTAGTVTTTQYTLHGSNLVHLVKGSKYMHFWYDAQNRPTIVNYNGTRYAYIVNLQGDVLGLVDSNGDEVVRYTYDAWGKVLSTTGTLASSLGALNPFRYRGYVYDTETTLYYLQARYYNPAWQRFVNADCLVQENLYCYCRNAPISFSDTTGSYPELVGTFADFAEVYDYYPGTTQKTSLVYRIKIGTSCRVVKQDNEQFYAYSEEINKYCFVDRRTVDTSFSYFDGDKIFGTIMNTSGYYHEKSKDENVRMINFCINRYLDTTRGLKNGIPYNHAPVSDEYTEKTREAIRQFQQDKGLINSKGKYDGLAGPTTLDALENWILIDNKNYH